MSCCDAPGLLRLEDGLNLLATSVKRQTVEETVNLSAALDRVLAHDIYAPRDIPNYDNSAMDGYALHLAENQAAAQSEFVLVGKSFAGCAFQGDVKVKECVRIMTGARVPADCNAVVMQENTTVEGEQITLTAPVQMGENIRQAGNDVRQGALVLAAGRHLGPLDIGMLASLGIAKISVSKKIRVAVFSTGDEITSLGEELKEGFIYDSNRYLIIAALQRMNVDIQDYGVLPDDPEVIEDTFIGAATTCDAIISSGGVSVGEADYTRDILHKLGDITFYKLAMKPGKPFAFGRIGKAVFFGLPGNPVSAAVTFHQLALPALLRMSGETGESAPWLGMQIRCISRLKKRPGRVDFQRGRLLRDADGNLCVESTGSQSSGALSSMVAANCYIKLEEARGDVEAGEEVEVLLFDRYIV